MALTHGPGSASEPPRRNVFHSAPGSLPAKSPVEQKETAEAVTPRQTATPEKSPERSLLETKRRDQVRSLYDSIKSVLQDEPTPAARANEESEANKPTPPRTNRPEPSSEAKKPEIVGAETKDSEKPSSPEPKNSAVTVEDTPAPAREKLETQQQTKRDADSAAVREEGLATKKLAQDTEQAFQELVKEEAEKNHLDDVEANAAERLAEELADDYADSERKTVSDKEEEGRKRGGRYRSDSDDDEEEVEGVEEIEKARNTSVPPKKTTLDKPLEAEFLSEKGEQKAVIEALPDGEEEEVDRSQDQAPGLQTLNVSILTSDPTPTSLANASNSTPSQASVGAALVGNASPTPSLDAVPVTQTTATVLPATSALTETTLPPPLSGAVTSSNPVPGTLESAQSNAVEGSLVVANPIPGVGENNTTVVSPTQGVAEVQGEPNNLVPSDNSTGLEPVQETAGELKTGQETSTGLETPNLTLETPEEKKDLSPELGVETPKETTPIAEEIKQAEEQQPVQEEQRVEDPPTQEEQERIEEQERLAAEEGEARREEAHQAEEAVKETQEEATKADAEAHRAQMESDSAKVEAESVRNRADLQVWRAQAEMERAGSRAQDLREQAAHAPPEEAARLNAEADALLAAAQALQAEAAEASAEARVMSAQAAQLEARSAAESARSDAISSDLEGARLAADEAHELARSVISESSSSVAVDTPPPAEIESGSTTPATPAPSGAIQSVSTLGASVGKLGGLSLKSSSSSLNSPTLGGLSSSPLKAQGSSLQSSDSGTSGLSGGISSGPDPSIGEPADPARDPRLAEPAEVRADLLSRQQLQEMVETQHESIQSQQARLEQKRPAEAETRAISSSRPRQAQTTSRRDAAAAVSQNQTDVARLEEEIQAAQMEADEAARAVVSARGKIHTGELDSIRIEGEAERAEAAKDQSDVERKIEDMRLEQKLKIEESTHKLEESEQIENEEKRDSDSLISSDSTAQGPSGNVSSETAENGSNSETIAPAVEEKVKETAEEPVEKPLENPVEKTAETVAEKLVEQPGDKVPEKEQTVQLPVENVVAPAVEEKVKETAEKPVEKPLENPVEKTAETVAEKLVEQPGDKVPEKEQTVQLPVENVVAPAIEEKVKETAEEPVEKPLEEPVEKTAETVAEKLVEQPGEQPGEKVPEKEQTVQLPVENVVAPAVEEKVKETAEKPVADQDVELGLLNPVSDEKKPADGEKKPTSGEGKDITQPPREQETRERYEEQVQEQRYQEEMQRQQQDARRAEQAAAEAQARAAEVATQAYHAQLEAERAFAVAETEKNRAELQAVTAKDELERAAYRAQELRAKAATAPPQEAALLRAEADSLIASAHSVHAGAQEATTRARVAGLKAAELGVKSQTISDKSDLILSDLNEALELAEGAKESVRQTAQTPPNGQGNLETPEMLTPKTEEPPTSTATPVPTKIEELKEAPTITPSRSDTEGIERPVKAQPSQELSEDAKEVLNLRDLEPVDPPRRDSLGESGKISPPAQSLAAPSQEQIVGTQVHPYESSKNQPTPPASQSLEQGPREGGLSRESQAVTGANRAEIEGLEEEIRQAELEAQTARRASIAAKGNVHASDLRSIAAAGDAERAEAVRVTEQAHEKIEAKRQLQKERVEDNEQKVQDTEQKLRERPPVEFAPQPVPSGAESAPVVPRETLVSPAASEERSDLKTPLERAHLVSGLLLPQPRPTRLEPKGETQSAILPTGEPKPISFVEPPQKSARTKPDSQPSPAFEISLPTDKPRQSGQPLSEDLNIPRTPALTEKPAIAASPQSPELEPSLGFEIPLPGNKPKRVEQPAPQTEKAKRPSTSDAFATTYPIEPPPSASFETPPQVITPVWESEVKPALRPIQPEVEAPPIDIRARTLELKRRTSPLGPQLPQRQEVIPVKPPANPPITGPVEVKTPEGEASGEGKSLFVRSKPELGRSREVGPSSVSEPDRPETAKISEVETISAQPRTVENTPQRRWSDQKNEQPGEIPETNDGSVLFLRTQKHQRRKDDPGRLLFSRDPEAQTKPASLQEQETILFESRKRREVEPSTAGQPRDELLLKRDKLRANTVWSKTSEPEDSASSSQEEKRVVQKALKEMAGQRVDIKKVDMTEDTSKVYAVVDERQKNTLDVKLLQQEFRQETGRELLVEEQKPKPIPARPRPPEEIHIEAEAVKATVRGKVSNTPSTNWERLDLEPKPPKKPEISSSKEGTKERAHQIYIRSEHQPHGTTPVSPLKPKNERPKEGGGEKDSGVGVIKGRPVGGARGVGLRGILNKETGGGGPTRGSANRFKKEKQEESETEVKRTDSGKPLANIREQLETESGQKITVTRTDLTAQELEDQSSEGSGGRRSNCSNCGTELPAAQAHNCPICAQAGPEVLALTKTNYRFAGQKFFATADTVVASSQARQAFETEALPNVVSLKYWPKLPGHKDILELRREA